MGQSKIDIIKCELSIMVVQLEIMKLDPTYDPPEDLLEVMFKKTLDLQKELDTIKKDMDGKRGWAT